MNVYDVYLLAEKTVLRNILIAQEMYIYSIVHDTFISQFNNFYYYTVACLAE